MAKPDDGIQIKVLKTSFRTSPLIKSIGMNSKITSQGIIAAIHQLAKTLNSDTPQAEIAKLLDEMANRLECEITRNSELQKQRDDMAQALVDKDKLCQMLADYALRLRSQHDVMAAENYDLKHPGTYLPSKCETPATDAFLNQLRTEGIHFATNYVLSAWVNGFIDDTPAQAYDISGSILMALEFLPTANPDSFSRVYADEVRTQIAKQLRASADGV